jgi:perosamine synthetase
VHLLTYYRTKYGLAPEDFPNAYAADRCSISLPLFNGMRPDEQDHVVNRVREGARGRLT